MLAPEAEAVDVAHRADHLPLVFGEVGLAAVFDQEQLVAVGDVAQRGHLTGVAEKMHGDDGARPGSDLGFDVRRVQRVGIVNVGENRHAVMQQSADDAAPRCPRRDDDLISRVRIDGADTGVHGRRAGSQGDDVGDAVPRRKFTLKLRHLRPFAERA